MDLHSEKVLDQLANMKLSESESMRLKISGVPGLNPKPRVPPGGGDGAGGETN